jgi:hypothetical protein
MVRMEGGAEWLGATRSSMMSWTRNGGGVEGRGAWDGTAPAQHLVGEAGAEGVVLQPRLAGTRQPPAVAGWARPP